MISKKDEHLSAMIQMCLDAKETKEELLKLFSDTFKDHWEMCCHYREQTQRLTVYKTLQFMSSYLDVEDEDAEIERLAMKILKK